MTSGRGSASAQPQTFRRALETCEAEDFSIQETFENAVMLKKCVTSVRDWSPFLPGGMVFHRVCEVTLDLTVHEVVKAVETSRCGVETTVVTSLYRQSGLHSTYYSAVAMQSGGGGGFENEYKKAWACLVFTLISFTHHRFNPVLLTFPTNHKMQLRFLFLASTGLGLVAANPARADAGCKMYDNEAPQKVSTCKFNQARNVNSCSGDDNICKHTSVGGSQTSNQSIDSANDDECKGRDLGVQCIQTVQCCTS